MVAIEFPVQCPPPAIGEHYSFPGHAMYCNPNPEDLTLSTCHLILCCNDAVSSPSCLEPVWVPEPALAAGLVAGMALLVALRGWRRSA